MNTCTFHNTRWEYILLLFGALILTPLPILAAETSFSWLPNSESDIIGYKIYYGEQSGDYNNVLTIDTPQVTDGKIHATLTELADNTTYHAAITAYSPTLESTMSNDISWTTAPASENQPPTPQIISVRETH